MTKILDNQCFTVPQPKMVELRKGLIINGQYYLKENMQPVPFSSISTPSAQTVNSNFYMHLDRRIGHAKNLQYAAPQIHSRILYDSDDEKITYVVYESGSYCWLEKFKEEDSRCLSVARIALKSNTDFEEIEKIENHKEGLIIYFGGPAIQGRVQIHNKETLVSTRTYTISSLTYSSTYPYDSNCIINNNFYYSSGYGGNRFSYFVDSLSRIIEQDVPDSSAGSSSNYRNRVYFNNALIDTDEKVSAAYPAVTTDTGIAFINEMWISTFDKVKNVFLPLEKIKVKNGTGVTSTAYYGISKYYVSDLWHKTINGKNYIFIYNRYNYDFMASRMIVLEEKVVDVSGVATKIYEVIKIQDFPMGQCGQIITFRDEAKLRFYGYSKTGTSVTDPMSSVYCYELDESTLTMTKTFNEDGIINEFGFDKDRSLYILWSDMSVSRYNERTVANFNAKFESGLYEYQGTDVETNLIVSTTSLEGKLLAKEVKLDIRGNAKFKANGTKTIIVTTLDTGDLNVPITITGAGSLNIFPKIKA